MMLRPNIRLLALCLLGSSGGLQLCQAQTQVPAAYATPPDTVDLTAPGFRVRVVQASWDANLPNTLERAEAQLAGTLVDPNTGLPYANEADLSWTDPDGFFTEEGPINYSENGPFSWDGNFPDDMPVPGIPGLSWHTDNYAAEFLTFLELPAGRHRLGVNSDDGFRLTIGVGLNSLSAFAVVAGEFDDGRPSADTQFDIDVSAPGLYPVRIIWEEGQGGSNIELFSMAPPDESGERILVNDPFDSRAIRAYRRLLPGQPTPPYAKLAHPLPGAQGVSPDTRVEIRLVDATTAVNPDSIVFWFDGAVVVPSRTIESDGVSLQYDPPGLLAPGSEHSYSLQFADNASTPTVQEHMATFTVGHYVGPTGNLYQIIRGRYTWEEARGAAEGRTLGGISGHLATITSQEEDAYLEAFRRENGLGGEAWVGGYQLPGQATPGDGWYWVNDEGAIAGANGGSNYANWRAGEPNDWVNSQNVEDDEENYLTIGLNNEFAWNDSSGPHDYIVEFERRIIPIDVKPGSDANVVQLDSQGQLPVAVLSAPGFNPATVDPTTIRLGRQGTEASPIRHTLVDLNRDKVADLLCHFRTQETGLTCDDLAAQLLATTFEGGPLRGSDAISPVGCPSFALGLAALQDVAGVTEVLVAVEALKANCPPPVIASHVQLKSFTLLGDLGWTRNESMVPLSIPDPEDSTSVGSLIYTDLRGGQPLQAQVQVQDCRGNRTDVLRAKGTVRLRPDLAIESVHVENPVYVRRIVNIPVLIRELNGDLGASARVLLREGDTLVDVADVPVIGPHESVTVVFAQRFLEPGSRSLTVEVGDVAPGDYDASNNAATVDLDVVAPPLETVFYSGAYYHTTSSWREVIDDPYLLLNRGADYTYEDLSLSLDIPVALEFPIGGVQVTLTVDGSPGPEYTISDIPVGYEDVGPDYYYGTASVDLGNETYFYVDSYRFGEEPGMTYAYFSKYAGDDVYFAEGFDRYWGQPIEDYFESRYGTYLEATESVVVRVVIDDEAGSFGGDALIAPLSTSPFDYEYEDSGPDYYYYYHEEGLLTWGNAYGETEP